MSTYNLVFEKSQSKIQLERFTQMPEHTLFVNIKEDGLARLITKYDSHARIMLIEDIFFSKSCFYANLRKLQELLV